MPTYTLSMGLAETDAGKVAISARDAREYESSVWYASVCRRTAGIPGLSERVRVAALAEARAWLEYARGIRLGTVEVD